MLERAHVARTILQLFTFPQRTWVQRLVSIHADAGMLTAEAMLPSPELAARGYSIDEAMQDRVLYPLSMAAVYALCPSPVIPFAHLGAPRGPEILRGVDLLYPECSFRACGELPPDEPFLVTLRVDHARTDGRGIRITFSVDAPSVGVVTIVLRPNRSHTRRV